MKVLLIHASIASCGFDALNKDGYRQGDVGWIHHGLCSISAYAKKTGFDIKLLDLRYLKGWDHFKEEILKGNPDVVGIGMMSVDYNPVMKCVDIIDEVSKKTIIVIGGPHPSIMKDEVIANSKIDHIIQGEGEISFTELLKDLVSGKSPARIIKGIVPKLDDLPFVDRNLYFSHESPIVPELPTPFMTIIAGRGCLYNCSFCQPAERMIFGKGVRRRSVNSIIQELKCLRDKYDFKSLMLHDDCITEDIEWINLFCEQYLKNGFNQPFVCQSRADIICNNEETVKRMKDSGLYMYLIGFESGNQRILNYLRKGTKVEHNFKAAEICEKYNIKIWANYMLGIPTETKEEVKDTVDMIRIIKPDYCSPAFFTPHPGSDLYEYCINNNLSLISSHDQYQRNPSGSKIKGVDYKFLQQAVLDSIGIKNRLYLDRIMKFKTIRSIKILLEKTFLGKYLIGLLKKLINLDYFRYKNGL